MLFKASIFQSAELQLTCKDNEFILFSIRRSKKNFIVKENEPFVFDNKLF